MQPRVLSIIIYSCIIGMPLAYRQEFSDTLRTIRISPFVFGNYSGAHNTSEHLNPSPMQLASYFISHEHSNLKCVYAL